MHGWFESILSCPLQLFQANIDFKYLRGREYSDAIPLVRSGANPAEYGFQIAHTSVDITVVKYDCNMRLPSGEICAEMVDINNVYTVGVRPRDLKTKIHRGGMCIHFVFKCLFNLS